MKFILNKTSGINEIEKISLENIIQTFSVPENIEINIDKSNILDIGLKYEDINLAIFYVINFINSEITKNYITVHFVIKKLYLDENIFIEENEKINKICVFDFPLPGCFFKSKEKFVNCINSSSRFENLLQKL